MTQESDPRLTESFYDTVRSASDVLIGTHLNPDGDAIGSALAVSLWLDGLGIPNEVLCHNLPPSYLEFLPSSDRLSQSPRRKGHDLAISVDLDSLDRLGSVRPWIESVPRLILVDHHIPHEMPGDLRIVDPSSPSTASILTDLFARLEPRPGATFTPGMATCLLTGLVTDTGGFRFPNTTAGSLHHAAFLVERGASLSQVMDECYLNKDEQSVRMLALALGDMKMSSDKRLAWVVLRPEWFERLGAGDEHTEGIVNEILSVRTVEAAFVIRAGKNGKVKGSLRSKGTIDVAKIAQSIGGGGHKNAAGVTLEDTLERAERTIYSHLVEALESR